MSIYYKFKSAKDYDSVAIESQYIFVGQLKEKIFGLKKYGRGIDYDLLVTNAQTDEEYVDEEMVIPKNTSVIIRRVPGPPRVPILTAPPPPAVSEQEEPKVETNPSSATRKAEEFDWHEFGNDVFAIPETRILVQEKESKMKALIETPGGLDCCDGKGGGGRGFFGRGGFGRGGFEKKTTPPQGYTCHRCKVPGHYIQHCPTNGDPNFDIGRVKPIKMATSGGAVTTTTRPVPPELHCPLCKQVMKDAVLTSKCCFASFCDTCIRDDIISKARCVCGATNVVADDLLPNKTLRDTINRILESRNPQANKVPSSQSAAASKGQEDDVPVQKRDETAKKVEESNNLPLPQEKGTSVQEDTSRRSDHEEVPVSVSVSGEAAGKKKMKKKKLRQEFPPEMPFAPAACAFNPYWSGGGFDGFMPYMSGYGINPMYDPFGCMLPYGPPPLPQRDLAELAAGPPPITSRHEFEAAPKAHLKRKREMEERQLSKDGSSRGGGYVSSRSNFKSTPPPPPPSADHHRHSSRSRDVVLPRPSSKNKYEHLPRFSNNRPVIV